VGRTCSVCARSDAGAIDELLRSGRSARAVALEVDLGEDAVLRHRTRHLGRRSEPPPSDPSGLDPLDELVDALRRRALDGDAVVAREYRLALAAQSAQAHATAPPVELATTREWLDLRSRLLEALEPFPDARIAVAEALA
jgi:hypothetical protein